MRSRRNHPRTRPRRGPLLLAGAVILSVVVFPVTAGAAHEEVCYVFADSGDRLGLLDRAAGIEIPFPNTAGAPDIEAIELDPTTGILYAIDADELGTLDRTTGAYSTIGVIGIGDPGGILLNDVDSMAFDASGTLWAVNASVGPDLLFQIDPATGALVQDTFGLGIDFLPILLGFNQIDDIGIDPGTGIMYGIHTNGSNDQLVTIDTTTAMATAVGTGTGIADMEGMTFDTTGQLIGTTGNAGPAGTNDSFFRVDKLTGLATFEVALGASGSDYEGVTCMTQGVDVSDLELSKTVDDPAPTVGQTVTITIEVVNQGEDNATGVEVVDQLPAGLDYVSDDSGGAYNPGTGVWTIGALANGATAALQIQAQVTAIGSITNVAEVSASDSVDPDSIPGNDDGDQSEDDEDAATVVAVSAPATADLSLSKAASDGTPTVGDTVTFTITVANAGPDDATGLAVEDVLPDGYSSPTGISNGGTAMGSTITWSGLSVAAGDILDLTFDVTIDTPTGSTDEYLNIAQVMAADQMDPDSTPDNDDGDQSEDDEANASVTPPIIGIAKSVASVVNNDDGTYLVTYLINIENLGLVTISDLVVTDDLASQLSGISPTGFTAISGSLDANPAWDGTGASNALDPGQSLGPGESETVMIGVTVTPGADLGPHFNQADVTGSDGADDVTDTSTNGFDPDPNGDGLPTEAVPTPVSFVEDPSIGLAKEVDTGPTLLGGGAYELTFRFVVVNTGDVDLSSVQVNDDLASSFATATSFTVDSITSADLTVNPGFDGDTDQAMLTGSDPLAVGESGTIVAVLTVVPGLDRGAYLNSAEASGTSPADAVVTDTSQDGADVDPDHDGDPTNNDDPTPVSFAELGALIGRVWLDENRDGVQDPAEPGIAGVTVSLVDPGGDGVVGGGDDTVLAVTSTSSDGGYSFADLEPGDFIVVVDAGTLPSDIVATFDPDGTLDSMTAVSVPSGATATGVDFGYDEPGFDLVLTKTAGAVSSNKEMTWTISITNTGPDPADGPITFIDELDADLALVTVDAPNSWTCGVAGQTVTCVRGASLPTGVTEQIQITTAVNAAPGTTISNQASVSAATTEVDIMNNTDTDSINVGPLPFTGFALDRVFLLALEVLGLGSVLVLAARQRREA